MFFDQMVVEHIPQLTVQKNHYYPFGLELSGLNKRNKPEYRWKFQGQEEQKEFGLNWSSFKWRNADVALGRFFSVDPLAEDYVYNSTYAFSENKVVVHFELEGLESVNSNGYAEYNYWKTAAQEEGPGLVEGGKQALKTTGKTLLTVGLLSGGMATAAGRANLLGQSVFQFGYAAYEGEPLVNAVGRIDQGDAVLAPFGWGGLVGSAFVDYTSQGGLESFFQSGDQHKPVENVLLDGGINGSLKFVGGKIAKAQSNARNAQILNEAERNSLLAGGDAAYPPRWRVSPGALEGAGRINDELGLLRTRVPDISGNIKVTGSLGMIVNTYSTNIVGKSSSGSAKKAVKQRVRPNRIQWEKVKTPKQQVNKLTNYLKSFK